MTKKDFNLIIYEAASTNMEDVKEFFERKRIKFNCNQEEFRNGLIEAFSRLNAIVSSTDYEPATYVFPNGTRREMYCKENHWFFLDDHSPVPKYLNDQLKAQN